MHKIEVIPCGRLADRFPKLKIAANTAADAIEGWSRQVSSKRIDTRISVVDFETEDQLMAPTEVKKLYIYPAMFGGGGKWGQIIIGAAMIAAAFIPGVGEAMHAALIISGSSMVVSGTFSLFMKSPSLSKEEDPPASKYIGSGKNTTAIGTIIGMGGGRMMAGGQYLSLQVNSSDLVYGEFPATPT